MTAHSRRYSYAAIAILTILLAIFILNVTSNGIFITEYIDDLYFIFDMSWRIKLNQVPHIDFISPIGQSFYWPFAVILWFVPYSAKVLLWVNLFVAAVASLIAWVVLPRRLPPLLFFLATAAIILAILSPRDADSFKGTVLTYLAPYNRWGWAWLGLVTYISLIPVRSEHSSRPATDGIILGILVILLFYLKITYFAAALIPILVGVFVKQVSFRQLSIAIFVFFTAVIFVELVNHNNFAYFSDIIYAINVSTSEVDPWRIQKFWRTIAIALAYCGFISALTILIKPLWQPRIWFRFWAKPVFMAALAIFTGAGVSFQNHSIRETNLYVVGLIVFAELARRAMGSASESASSHRSGAVFWSRLGASRLAVIITVGATSLFAVVDASSIIREAAATHDGTGCFVPALRDTPLSGFMQTPRAMEGTDRKLDTMGHKEGPAPTCENAKILKAGFNRPDPSLFHTEVPLLSDAMPILRKTLTRSDRVLVLDFANPYAAIFQLEPTEHDLAWWDESRTISLEHYPAPSSLLKSATVIMQRKEDQSPLLWQLYGKSIFANYHVVSETPWWRVWRRRVSAQ